MTELFDGIKTAHEPTRVQYRIDSNMTREQLRKLKPRGAQKVVLLVDGEKYPERHYNADEIDNFAGINGKVVFI